MRNERKRIWVVAMEKTESKGNHFPIRLNRSGSLRFFKIERSGTEEKSICSIRNSKDENGILLFSDKKMDPTLDPFIRRKTVLRILQSFFLH
ncbi:hypothetical protein DLM75_04875 [Leptospira stimsonii]|uniref:Uncharacterized protein n=1 Tax=Leptospira stimsonii TaxID=2202203 RepID=A0A396ZH93_9LEPT|nr:hypothetical protein DLM75_04875 [Leptospira stimsonii]